MSGNDLPWWPMTDTMLRDALSGYYPSDELEKLDRLALVKLWNEKALEREAALTAMIKGLC